MKTHDVGNTPQLFVDDHLVDNRWGVEYLTETVIRVFHAPIKHEANPLVSGTGGMLNVVWDEEAGLFRMWYQEYWDQSFEPRLYTYAVAYAESPNRRMDSTGGCRRSVSTNSRARNRTTSFSSDRREDAPRHPA